MDPKALLDRFLGPQASSQLGAAAEQLRGRLPSGAGGMAGGAAAAGVLALLLSSKKARKLAGGAAKVGGAAALGALAWRAWQNWQGQPAAPAAPVPAPFQVELARGADGRPFALSLVLAMVAAARADGEVDADEQQAIFARVEQSGLDAEAKALVFDALRNPPEIGALAQAAATPEQAAELYLAARLAIDPDEPAERAWLDAFAHRLALPAGLPQELDRQAASLG